MVPGSLTPSPPLWPHWRAEWVVHEDSDVVVIDKPAGVAVYPSDEREVSDVGTRVARWLTQRDGAPAPLATVHGLDRDASGVVILSRTKQASKSMAEQLSRGVERSYLVGIARRPQGRTSFALTEREKKDARRLVEVTWSERSQPLRRTLAKAGAPVAGDRDNDGAPAARLMMHVEAMRIVHPGSKRGLSLRAPAPPAFDRWLALPTGRLPDDRSALASVLGAAVDRRYAVAWRGDTNAFRVAHGGGDELPGVEIDAYDRWAVLATAGAEADDARERLLDAIHALGFEGVYLKRRPKHASVVGDTRITELAPPAALRGSDAPDPLTVVEAGVEYEVRLGDGLSTGLFLDQRAARERVRALAADRSVLNLFAYHGAFTIAAIAGGARSSISVDVSAVALARAALGLLRVGAASERHALVRADVLSWLREAERARQRFDLVILDPPSFSTSKRSRFRAASDYHRLAALALGCVAPGGVLFACTNHRGIVPAELRRELTLGARQARRDIAAMHDLPDPVDFPSAPGRPCHIKRVLVEVAR